MFVMKDQDFYGAKNDYMAEAFVRVSDASDAAQSTYPKQIHLKLNRPSNAGMFGKLGCHCVDSIDVNFGYFVFSESDILKALDYRSGDKLARDFAKKQKLRMEVPH